MPPVTVLASLPSALVAAVSTYQVDVGALLRDAGIDRGVFDTPGARIADEKIRRLWRLAVEATGDP